MIIQPTTFSYILYHSRIGKRSSALWPRYSRWELLPAFIYITYIVRTALDCSSNLIDQCTQLLRHNLTRLFWFAIISTMDDRQIHLPNGNVSTGRATLLRRKFVLCFDGTGNKFSGTAADSNSMCILPTVAHHCSRVGGRFRGPQ